MGSADDFELWRDPTASTDDRVTDLLSRMTLREKLGQLYALWVGIDDGGQVAPHQQDFASTPPKWEEIAAFGLGQLTRPYGTTPVDPVSGAKRLALFQRRIMQEGRFGIPAMVHEECLTGLSAWQATIYPSPLCWGAGFDPGIIEEMGAQIGRSMRRLGIHQGLAPVLDVARDLRWGRVEETIGEDPYLVGTIGSAFVRGLEAAGVVSTLKHFVGYSSSRAGRNFAPVSIGGRELRDVLLPPFEMALRAGARSVMNAYTDIDGLPVAADPAILTNLLRRDYGFSGHGRFRLFFGIFPPLPARGGRSTRRGGRQSLERGYRCRASDRGVLRRRLGRRRAAGPRRSRPCGPRRAAGPCPEM